MKMASDNTGYKRLCKLEVEHNIQMFTKYFLHRSNIFSDILMNVTINYLKISCQHHLISHLLLNFLTRIQDYSSTAIGNVFIHSSLIMVVNY
jgi:hypothetical protein